MNKINLRAGILIFFVMTGTALIFSSCSPAKAPAAKVPAGQKGTPAAASKKVLSKGMGGLTVKVVNYRKAPASLTVRAFRSVDSRSSVLQAAFPANSMQELLPGTYDIELNSTPQRIFKGIRVSEGRETVEDLGCLTGSLNVKALNPDNKAASYPVRVFRAGTRISAGVSATNRIMEMSPGLYDIEIGIVPMLVKKNVRVGAGTESVVDIGQVTGKLLVRAVDENKKELRFSFRIKNAGKNDIIATGYTNRPLEIAEGAYDIEITSSPLQGNKAVSVRSGSETVVEAMLAAPAQGAPEITSPVPAKSSPGLPVKKK